MHRWRWASASRWQRGRKKSSPLTYRPQRPPAASTWNKFTRWTEPTPPRPITFLPAARPNSQSVLPLRSRDWGSSWVLWWLSSYRRSGAAYATKATRQNQGEREKRVEGEGERMRGGRVLS